MTTILELGGLDILVEMFSSFILASHLAVALAVVCAAILLALRHPFWGKPDWTAILIVLGLAYTLVTACRTSPYGALQSLAYNGVIYGPSLIVVLLLRAVGRFCITNVPDDELPSRGRFSIMSLLYWVTAFAFSFAVVPVVVRTALQVDVTIAMPLSWVLFHHTVTISAIAGPLLAGFVLRNRSWPIRAAGIFLCVCICRFGMDFLVSWLLSEPSSTMRFFYAYLSWCFLYALSITFAFWLNERGGRKIKRFPKYSINAAE